MPALRGKVAGTVFDLLFVNAGITNGDVPVTGVSTETFQDVMVTNALGPMRAVEALNQLMRSFAARHSDDPRTLLLISPGWVRTALAGPNARLTVEESIPAVVDTITTHAGAGGVHFLDYRNQTLPW